MTVEQQSILKLWEYVPLEEYQIPSKPISEKVKSGLSNFIAKIFNSNHKTEEYQPYNTLTAFSESKLERIVPQPDWHVAIEEIDNIIEEFQSSISSKYVLAFIDRPYSGTEDILRAWAASREDVSVVPPPKYEDIINDQEAVIDELEQNLDGLCLIPDLQNYFLRHEKGLNIVRSLNGLFSRHNDEPIILGCQSYAWKFLTEVLHLNLKNIKVLIQQSLDHEKLEQWILGITEKVKKRILLYRDGSNGKYIFDKQAEQLKKKNKSVSSDDRFLQNLASYSHGLPLVAREIWKHCLRILPEDELSLDDEETNNPEITYTIWVVPWSKLSLPAISYNYSRNELYILHALLLHSGLSLKWLSTLLTDIDLYGRLQKLKKKGVVIRDEDDVYRVNPLAYPNVRQTLLAEGYLVDTLE